jgi:uroporphyrinogen decarboxylase
MKKPTLRDVALAADVSVTTASLVLSGKGRISGPVRTAILEAATALGYGKKFILSQPGKRPAVGILLSIDPHWAFVWSFIRPIIAEIERIFTEKGYDITLIPIYDTMSDTAMLDTIIQGSYKAIFTLHFGNERLFNALEEHNIPVIIIMNGNFQDRFHSILVDDFQGSYEGTIHLIKLGHREIIYAGTERIDLPKLTTDRYYGFCKALEESGIPVTPQGYLNCEAANTQHLEASLREIFARTQRPSAIFAIDDDMAIRIAALLKPMGIRIPEEVSIIAPGDLLNYADPFVIPITTLKIDTTLMGRLACDMMFRRLSGEHNGVHVIKIKQQLVQRGSTRPLPSARVRGIRQAIGNSKERFLGSFTRSSGHGLARWLGASREFITKACIELHMDEEQFRLRIGDDLRWIDHDPIGQGGRLIDAFGIERRGSGYGQPTSHPLHEAPTIDRLRNYPWPDPEQEDTSSIRERIDPLVDRFAIIGGSWSPFWHDAVDLVGMETMACLMYDDPVFVETMLGRIVDYYVSLNTRIFEEAGDLIDLLFIRNDFGTQTGPLISMEHFDRFISPCIKRLVEVAHRYDIKTMLHSSGGIRPLLQSIIGTGIDALHALQPDCPGMQGGAIKKEFGNKLVLSGGIDARGILLNGTPSEVRESVFETLRILAPGGGYLAAPSVDAITEDTPVANILAMYDAIAEWQGTP